MGSGSQPKPYWLDIVLCESIQYTKPKAEQMIYELNSGSRNFMSLGPIPSAERVETISDLKKYIQRNFQITLPISLFGSNGKYLQNSKSVQALRQHDPLMVRPADSEKHISTPKSSSMHVPHLNCSLSPISTRLNAPKNTTVTSAVSFSEDVTSPKEDSHSDSDSDTEVFCCSNDSSEADETLGTAVNRIAARKKLNFPAKEMTYSKWQLLEIQRSIIQFMNDGDSEDKESLQKWTFEFFGDCRPRGQSNASSTKITVSKCSIYDHDLTSQPEPDVSAVANLFERVAIIKPTAIPEHVAGPPLDRDVEDSTSRNEDDPDNRKGSRNTSSHSLSDNSNNTGSSSCETSETTDEIVSNPHNSNTCSLRRSRRVAFRSSHLQKDAPQKPKFAKKAEQTFPTSKTKTVKAKAKLNRHSCSYSCCNFSTQGLSALKIHLCKVHFETPFKCTKCGRKYRFYHSLYSHLKTHGQKKHVCPFQNCSYKSVRSSHLKQHMMMHRGEKPFACKRCEYKASNSSHLTAHMRIHTGEKPFACKQCDYRCCRKDNLKTHINNRHGVNK